MHKLVLDQGGLARLDFFYYSALVALSILQHQGQDEQGQKSKEEFLEGTL